MSKAARILKGPPRTLETNISFGQFILEKLRQHYEKVFEIDAETGQFLTYKDMLEKTVKLTEILKKRNVQIEDKVSIIAENHCNWFVAAFASIFLGAVVAPINPVYTEIELKHVLGISKPRIIFVSRRTEKLVSKVVPTLPWNIELIELDDEALNNNVPTIKNLLKTIDDEIDYHRYTLIDIGDNKKRPVVILCSSGTTGLPKGVALSHWNFLNFSTTIGTSNYLDITPDARALLFLPLYHGYAFGVMALITNAGGTIIRITNFSPDLLFKSIEKYRITLLPIVPSVLIILAKHPSALNYNFRSVKRAFCGAAPLPKEIILEAKKRLNVKSIDNGYGMTELTVLTGMSNKLGNNDSAITNIVPGVQCKIVNPETQETLGPMQKGELCVKGDHIIMLGYYNNPKATNETIDKDGWLHTGDVAYYTETGDLYVIDRLKELIKYKGYQVSPVEIEVLLLSHPAVKDVAVAGKPDEFAGELPTAFIAKQPNSNVNPQEIIDFVKNQLSPQKWLRGGVHFLESIPRNSTGKVMRRELRNLASRL
ncbi:PREDICTED: 4-coumarate--CoA ligase 1-like [Polistes dominula]|uniref:4-coumarate--CoA ligase 1-like n=1 Tax=Polistes dominula TaxID=743375 RepID=A0ABM1I6E0_POLDO|nr:PREDICTED: 4-coumarate--CoA ligase 1-like [Polistes dominula]XP_015175778.1 PREDICTED: 4-coumarate--CoA ligase 1-like [Polistes dominula]XP_015175779.1 PREDICTED: 4-coumarate--CoA ligase 1-like [Polistes dominula]XP_015179519.1 PREDICTED: 4-coumarate--CoA ligase 1-like [Polistes dominula]